MEQIDNEILTRCQRGDKTAFKWVVERYQQMLFSLSLKMLGDEEEAKDVVQETFIRVWQNLRNYDPKRSFTTWLYTIATRQCLDRMKANKLVFVRCLMTSVSYIVLPLTTTVNERWRIANGYLLSGC